MLKKLLNKAYRNQKGITGLETAIILIAFVVVAAVFAYTVLSAGLFSSQKGSEAVYTALEDTQSSMELRGGMTAYVSIANNASADASAEDIDRDATGDGTDTYTTEGVVTRLQFTVANALGGEPIDLTPSYNVAGDAVDPPGALTANVDGLGNAQNETIITYTDEDNYFNNCAWTVDWIGERDSEQQTLGLPADFLLEPGEKAQITVWLMQHPDANAFSLPASGTANFFDEGDDTDPAVADHTLIDNDHTFTVEVKTPSGAVLAMERTTPSFLDNVVDLH